MRTAAGTSNPLFTTDTAAALHAVETNCDVILKGAQVNGVHTADPEKKKEDAVMYDRLFYKDLLTRDLKVVDASAISLARENSVPIIVFFSLKEDKIACTRFEFYYLTKLLDTELFIIITCKHCLGSQECTQLSS